MVGKKVDIVHYKDGTRTVVGKAYVEIDGTHFDITGKITHDDGSGLYGAVVGDIKHLSIALKTPDIEENQDG